MVIEQSSGIFPKRWKNSQVIVVPKTRKHKLFPQNYQLISMLLVMSKKTERIVVRRLEEHTEELSILRDEQFEFRRQYSTEWQVLRLVE